MRSMLTLITMILATAAAATPTNLVVVVHDWDFAAGDHGFTSQRCDPGANPAWEFGMPQRYPEATMWTTGLADEYPSLAGDALVSPSFEVTPSTYLVEIHHEIRTEGWFAGGNVVVNGEIVEPLEGYNAEAISPSELATPFCVDEEPGFTSVLHWNTRTFDLSAFMGQTVSVGFHFGSDASWTMPGWFLGAVRVGHDGSVATEATSWSDIKARFH